MIGIHIRQIRENNGYLLRQMAAILDVDTTILSKMERGERPFKREHIVKVAEACSCNKEELLTMWLADRINNVIENEDCAIKALDLVKEQKQNE